MTRLEFFVFSLWGAALLLVALNIVYHVYFKITLIYMRFLDTIRFTLGMLILQIRYFFSRKKEILSHSKTQPYIEVLTLSELDNPAPHALPTSAKQSCNPPKQSPKKRDSKGRFVRN